MLTVPFWAKVKTEVLAAFLAGALPSDASHLSGVKIVEAGRLSAPSGWIVAGEPYLRGMPAALSPRVPPGDYPVRLVVFEFPSGDKRVGLAQVVVSDSPVARWAFAGTTAEPIEDVPEGEIIGFDVDGGMAAFIDLANAPALLAVGAEDEDYSDLTRVAYENYQHTFAWANYPLGANSGQNLVLFSAGAGDGFYWTYVGLDADGQVASFVTDFFLATLSEPVTPAP
jgi:hypothetical protein